MSTLKIVFLISIVASTTIVGLTAYATTAPAAGQVITKNETLEINRAPEKWFAGSAEYSRLPILFSSGSVAPALVTFNAGALTNWHIHPSGQYLIVIEGEGRTQEWGKPIQTLAKGDIVWCPPGVKHWHGANARSAMTHIALSPVATEEQKIIWLEKVDLPNVTHKKSILPQTNSEYELTEKQLSLVAIAAFSTIGDIKKLKPALVYGLERGLTVNELKEVFAHQYAYIGFPRALNAMLTLKSLLEEREKQNIKDIPGPEPTHVPEETNYYQRGNQTLSHLTGRSLQDVSAPLFDNFSPTIDYALKTHLFGYLFSRDNLGYLERELVVISSLSVLENVNAQLNSHLKITRNLGVNSVEMEKIFTTLEQNTSAKIAHNTRDVWQKIK